MTQRFLQKMNSDCQLVEAGTIFRLFDAKCSKYLLNYKYTGPLSKNPAPHVNPFKWKVARSDKKSAYIAEESGNQIQVCDTENVLKPFAKKHFMLRMKCKPPIRCPYNRPTYINVSSVYSEAVVNTVTSAPVSSEQLWDGTSTTMSFSVSPPSIGDPWDFGSSGQGSASIRLTIDAGDPDDTCAQVGITIEYTLNSLGLAWDYLAGMEVKQYRNIGCEGLQRGEGRYAFWTGVARPRGPIGLVMVLDATVWGRMG